MSPRVGETLKNQSQRYVDRARGMSNRFDYHEGKLTRGVEHQTSKIPSITFLNLAIGSMVTSLGIALFSSEERKPIANFIGLWAPSFLLMGIYNKLVKIEGSDRYEFDEIHRRSA